MLDGGSIITYISRGVADQLAIQVKPMDDPEAFSTAGQDRLVLYGTADVILTVWGADGSALDIKIEDVRVQDTTRPVVIIGVDVLYGTPGICSPWVIDYSGEVTIHNPKLGNVPPLNSVELTVPPKFRKPRPPKAKVQPYYPGGGAPKAPLSQPQAGQA